MIDIPLKYYIDWAGLEDFKDYDRDENGLPRVPCPDGIGFYYNPITIAQYGLHSLSRYQTSSLKSLKTIAFDCGTWLVENVQPWAEGSLAWIYDFDLRFYGQKAPWISAMAQGESISLMLRLYHLKQDKVYLTTALGAIQPFSSPACRKGVLDYLSDGSVVFEEYPARPAAHVLNGHIFSLLGVWDYALFFSDNQMMALAREGVNTLVKNWRQWDTGYWTRYDLFEPNRLASPMYHELHIRQMEALADLFELPALRAPARRWRSMQKSALARARWVARKVREKIQLKGRGL